jgi:hypothetical protein
MLYYFIGFLFFLGISEKLNFSSLISIAFFLDVSLIFAHILSTQACEPDQAEGKIVLLNELAIHINFTEESRFFISNQ